MKKTIWIKPFKGPFQKEEAEKAAAGFKAMVQPAKNLIYDARAVPRQGTEMYDIEIMTTVTNMFVRSAAGRAA